MQIPPRHHNPDVLTCIANLSNDEVFTPPSIAHQMLNQLEQIWATQNNGENLWANSEVTFIDPFSKSGVFLREITQRLVNGLASEFPDLQERVDHILTHQVFGIAVTELTSLLSRRSLYCSKNANGPHSICTSFDDSQGNIWFERMDHTWVKGTRKFTLNPATGIEEIKYFNRVCKFCGAKEAHYNRGEALESYAYSLIHTPNTRSFIDEIFGENMHFDVVIGNPPYQLSDGGAGKSAKPIFQLFVESAKSLEPRYISMITPSRWMAGGKGLDAFRKEMLSDKRIRKITDYIDSNEAFPGVDIAGGVSYFLWSRDEPGSCDITTIVREKVFETKDRDLNEYDVLIRYADALSILRKIWPRGVRHEESLGSRVSGRNAFGFATNAVGKEDSDMIPDPVELVSSRGKSFVPRAEVSSNQNWVDKWKATVSRASPAGGRPDKDGKFYGLSSIRVIPPGTVTSEAYPVVSTFASKNEAENMCTYLRTKFLRFLLTLRSANQSVGRATFGFVPILPMDQAWNDQMLYERFGLEEKEIDLIESMVRGMDDE